MTLFSTERRPFLMRKLHSLSGVVPVGLFLMFHLWTNAKAIQGQQVFDDAVDDIHRMPYLLVLEVGVVLLPLLFHTLYGVKIAIEGRSNVGTYPYSKNWAYTLQRLTGVVALLFIGYHLWEFPVQVWLGRMTPDDFFPHLCKSMSSTNSMGIPLVAVAYLVGVAASAYHFANGLYGFCFSWGITVSRRATRLASAAFGVFGVALFILGANTVIYFATGSSLVLSPGTHEDARRVTCKNPVTAPTPLTQLTPTRGASAL